MGTGMAWDCSMGVLGDFAGNDHYKATGGLTQGTGQQMGFGILFDYDGDDVYEGYGQGYAATGQTLPSVARLRRQLRLPRRLRRQRQVRLRGAEQQLSAARHGRRIPHRPAAAGRDPAHRRATEILPRREQGQQPNHGAEIEQVALRENVRRKNPFSRDVKPFSRDPKGSRVKRYNNIAIRIANHRDAMPWNDTTL